MDFKSDYQIATTAGRRIKARIEVIDQSVILHSRGGATGGRPPRNEGYAEALVIICQRAMRNRDYLERILLDSAPARLLPEVQRVLIDKPELKDLDADTLAKTIRVRMRRFWAEGWRVRGQLDQANPL